jgi:hypothetical protein
VKEKGRAKVKSKMVLFERDKQNVGLKLRKSLPAWHSTYQSLQDG